MRGFLACLGALALVCAATPAAASSAPGIAYGLTDDAWLANGPGHGRGPGGDARRARRAGRPLHGALGPGRADRARRSRPIRRIPPTTGRRRAACSTRFTRTASTSSSSSTAHRRGRTAASRRTTSRRARSRSAHSRPRSRTSTRGCKKFQIWNEPNQARWLRPTSAPLYVTRLLNPAYTAIHAATKRREGRRRRNRAARLDRRRLARRLDHGDAPRPRAARRLRAQPLSARPEARDSAARARVQGLHDGDDGDAQPPRATRRRSTSRARGSG